MILIGLTGGIGAGKTTVSDYLKEKGYTVLDADLVAREIVEPGTETLLTLAEIFGKDIIDPDGSLNRGRLADIAFSDPKKKKLLDRIMHGKVIKILLDRAKTMSDQQLVFIDVPLLFESGMDQYMDQVWLVDADDEVRILRVMDRDGSSREEVLNRSDISWEGMKKKKKHISYWITVELKDPFIIKLIKYLTYLSRKKTYDSKIFFQNSTRFYNHAVYCRMR